MTNKTKGKKKIEKKAKMVVEPNASLQRVQFGYWRYSSLNVIDVARIDIGQSHYAHLRSFTSGDIKIVEDALI